MRAGERPSGCEADQSPRADTTAPAPVRREGGFALLIVLLTLGFLALIATRELADARLEARLALAAQARAQDDASLDAATQTTLFHLLTPGNAAWPRTGQHTLGADGDTTITVRTRPLDGRIPLNFAGPTLLAGLLQACHVQPDAALALASAMIAWRDPSAAREAAPSYRGALWGPPGAPFRNVADMALVHGMTPTLVRCMTPHMSIYQRDLPTIGTPDPVVRAAIILSQNAALPSVPVINGQNSDALTGGGQAQGSDAAGPGNQGAGNAGPVIGGSSDPVMRIDIDLTRGPVRRHLALVAGLAGPNDPAPYEILARQADTAADLQ